MLTRLRARYHYWLGLARRAPGIRSGDRAGYEAAIDVLSLALVLNPARAPGNFACRVVYWRELSGHERAVREFSESLILSLKHAGAALNLALADVYGRLRTSSGSGPQGRPTAMGEAGSLVPVERMADFEHYLELGKNGHWRIQAYNKIERMQGSAS